MRKMGSTVTIVMYHFVRDLEHSRYPEIKGLRLGEFKEQLAYIQRHYNIMRMEDLMAAAESPGKSLPARPLLLTFDDGYLDHFTNVYPLLDELGVQGSFFPPARAVLEHKVLDVNKIHFILASVLDKSKIIQFIFQMLKELGEEFCLIDQEYYRANVPTDSRYDTREVMFIKAMLQRELPEVVRKIIVDRLFKKYVSSDEAAFSRELYMDLDQIRCMKRNGMFIGSHGYDHYWLGTLDPASQEREIDLSLGFLKDIGSDLENWVMCYPYGSYNDSLLTLLTQKGCKLGVTVEVALADLERGNPLLLPRLDANDLPKDRNAQGNEWTLRATSGGGRQ